MLFLLGYYHGLFVDSLAISFYSVYFHDAVSNGWKPLQNFNGVVMAVHGGGAIGCVQSKGKYDELT